MCGWGALAGLAELSRSAGRPLWWVAGEPPEGTGTVGMGRLVGTPLSSTGNPHTGHVWCSLVYTRTQPRLARPGCLQLAGGQRAGILLLICLAPGAVRAPWPLDIFLPLKSYLRTFGSLAIFMY